MKKFILGMFSFLMVFLLAGQGVYASEIVEEVSQENEERIEEMLDVEDGYFELSNQDLVEIEDLIGEENTQYLVDFLDVYNECVDEGEVEITENGTIIDLEDDRLQVQGGNVSKTKSYWWGVRNYFSHSDAKSYKTKLSKITKTMTVVNAALTMISYYPTSASITLAKSVAKALSYGIYTYVSSLNTKVKSVYNKLSSNQGMVVEFKAWLTYSVYKQ